MQYIYCMYIYIYFLDDVGRGMVAGYEAPPFKESRLQVLYSEEFLGDANYDMLSVREVS